MAKKRRKRIKCFKTKYKDGINYCLTFLFKGSKDSGPCFDIPEESIDDVITSLKESKKAKALVYKPDPKDEEHEKQWKEKTSKWHYKIWDKYFRNVTVSLNFFDWKLSTFWVSKKTKAAGSRERVYEMCSGFYFGPLVVTW